MISLVEQNCRTKGQTLKNMNKDFPMFVKNIRAKYPAYSKSIENCMTSVKNVISELTKWSHIGSDVKSSISLDWFKSLLKTVLKCAKHGLFFASALLRRITKDANKTYFDTVTASAMTGVITAFAFGITGILVGVVASVIILGIALWNESAKRKMYNIKKKPSLLDALKKRISRAKKMIGGDDDEWPEELQPPEPSVPNVSASFIHEGKITESMEMVGAALFALFLKAAIAHRFNEEMKEKTAILSSLISPTGALMGFLSVLLLIGSGGSSAVFV